MPQQIVYPLSTQTLDSSYPGTRGHIDSIAKVGSGHSGSRLVAADELVRFVGQLRAFLPSGQWRFVACTCTREGECHNTNINQITSYLAVQLVALFPSELLHAVCVCVCNSTPSYRLAHASLSIVCAGTRRAHCAGYLFTDRPTVQMPHGP